MIILACLWIEITFLCWYIKSNETERNDLKNCFLTIENFITVRQNYNNSENFLNKFEMKTYASSYTSPFLIELIQNSNRDCLCCP